MLEHILKRASSTADIDDFVAHLLAITRDAERVVLGYYNNLQHEDVTHKADDSPVTAADHASHDLLLAALQQLTPEIPILSEESAAADIAARLSWPAVWVVDPLDGTKEFIAQTGEFTINIALVAEGRPLLGLLARPTSGEIFVGIPGFGAWCYRQDANARERRTALRTRLLDASAPVTILASSRHSPTRVDAVMQALSGLGAGVARSNAGSALKFSALATGSADVYPRTSPCYEWDVAAGDALVEAAGGCVLGLDGEPLRYNQRDTLLAPRFIAQADPSVNYLDKLRDQLHASACQH